MRERTPGVWRLRVMVDGRQVQQTFRGTEAAARKRLRVMVDGRQVQQTFRGTEAAARKRLRSLSVEPEVAVVTDGRTFGALLTKWQAHTKARGRSPKTLHENRREIETRIRPRLGHIAVADLSAEDLDSAFSAWLDEGLAASSVHRHAAVISAALAQGVKWGWLATSPATRASAPSATSARKLVTPTRDHVAALIRTAQLADPLMAAAVALAYVTGARRGELCALRWSDINLEAGTIRVERSLSQVGSDLTTKTTKTGRGRTIGLDALAVATLRRHAAWQFDLADRAQSPLVEDPYVLSDNANAGRPMMPSHVTDRFRRLRRKAGVGGVRFHDLRHASVTEQLAAGVDAVTVAARVGHASTRMTLDRYAHALPAGDVAAAAVMGALLPRE